MKKGNTVEQRYQSAKARYAEMGVNTDQALAALEESGIEDGYVQDLSAAGEEEIPAFDGTGV